MGAYRDAFIHYYLDQQPRTLDRHFPDAFPYAQMDAPLSPLPQFEVPTPVEADPEEVHIVPKLGKSVYPLSCRHSLCLDCQRRHANQATEQQRAQAEFEQQITFHRINRVAMTRGIGGWPILSKKELIRPMNITINGNYRL